MTDGLITQVFPPAVDNTVLTTDCGYLHYDGGYWLVAMSPRRPSTPFACVRWSTEHALADTLANFAGRPVAMLRTLQDVDTAEDWHRITARGTRHA